MVDVLLFQIFRIEKLHCRSSWAHFLGLTPEEAALSVIDSMDEDCIYRRIHPEDLVEKRLLSISFFRRPFRCLPKNG